MTTNSYSTVWSHTNDAEFRAWGSALSAALAAVGLTQTADSGQINWLTVSRPGTNTAAGYEIWRFNDALQATAPIYIKVEYGTGGSTTRPQIWITVGTGTNGAGTITGQSSTRSTCMRDSAIDSPNVTPYPTYVCYNATEGFLGVGIKMGSAGVSTWGAGFFAIARSVNQDDGDTNGNACVVYTGSSTTGVGAPTAQSIRFANVAATYSASTAFCIVPANQTTSLVGADNQAYLHFMVDPQVLAVKQLCTIVANEVPLGNTFTATLIADPKTYISLGQNGPPGNSTGASSTTWTIAMLWE